MNNLVKGLAIAAAISLAGCATASHRSAERMNGCERTIYYSTSADRRTTLDCANLLEIWH